jgi:hypothetical protein
MTMAQPCRLGSLEKEYGFRHKEPIKILKRVSQDAKKMTNAMDI